MNQQTQLSSQGDRMGRGLNKSKEEELFTLIEESYMRFQRVSDNTRLKFRMGRVV